MKIARVQYDGEGEWLDVRFQNGEAFRFSSDLLFWATESMEAGYIEGLTPNDLTEGIKKLP